VGIVGSGIGVGAGGRVGSGVGVGMGCAHADRTSKAKSNGITQFRFMTVYYFSKLVTSNIELSSLRGTDCELP
jgi:hypothetical protein